MYENRRMKSVEIVLGRRGVGKRENDGEVKANLRYIISTCKYHNVSPCTTIIF
jgi:hypothetical protein